MFLYPLLGGTILIFLQRYISSFFRTVYGCGVFTLTLGSFLQGVLIIAGTDSPYVKAYFIAGGLLLLGSFISFKISKQSKVAK